ncbi:hypothetical protein IQ224_02335 [Microcystis sp. LEGE 00066]|uniref:Genome sequencing data, contig C301 n=2 Tax=Microcystis aeruginosa (strain PCC 7806) TaxID=267872 RepID=A8YEV8_MICA7|nr:MULTISPECIES: hypothetical protein [Microcystis]TRU05533.1 MAG: hypothetical protein EWV61_04475 [Microcystis aeruginosa Ma_AC_P_19900807_S300]ARI81742.1 hypothetical protein BH695_2462 [Microcystis aeruginosa PCC 7806SL]ELS47403.1 hypothetical protein C789_2806 [Microcystis aeruginosa FACHB-905 = DIANCHI905]MBE9261108.1 hypothetical protein [Microcystis sp. LEGE 00066]UGS11231.1 hypothetical protein LRR78_11920 [Microcystis aeruginosa FACHB-905 = DIANCHI905]
MLGAKTSLNLSLLKTLGLVAVIGGLMVAMVEMQQEKVKTLTKEKLLERNYSQESLLKNAQVELLKNIPSFGFDNMLANWAMLQFIQYYGDGDARRETGYGLSPDFMEIVTKNDPKFVRAYLMMSVASSVNAGKPERTIEIMNKGLAKLSPDINDAYFVWLYKGVDELLFLGDIPAAKKSNQMAADWAKIAGNEFIEKSARGTVKFLETNPDSRAPRVGAWMLVWINSQDEETRRLAKENIEKLGGKLVVVNNNQVMAIPPKD